jgi:hypothetical protein
MPLPTNIMIDDTYITLKTLPTLERKAVTVTITEVCTLNLAFEEGWHVEHMCPFPSTIETTGPILVILKREKIND